ncbi:MAG TPA: nitroreductase family protein [Thermodesulfobacteriota bacterium]|nr:nitroreductase family protein [Deltaproteobacteria bacterium]HNR14623.1 nitroreductase family protein [Thermodesulfobacteriota bacterium]HOC39330.1 nitroreductase family protein [Thermodesulfobacteriota bacterium]
MTFTIDERKCKRDGWCAEECPSRIIQLRSAEQVPTPTAEFDQYCLRCGHCVAVCPHGAFSLPWLKPQDCLPIRKELVLTEPQAAQFLRSRRSTRTFTEKPLSRPLLERLLEIAGYAASAKNEQPWHWLVVERPAEVRRLVGLVIDWMQEMIKNNREDAVRRGFPHIVTAWGMGNDRVCRSAPHLILAHADRGWRFASEDCANALTYLDLYAHAIGLGTCWAGYFYTAVNNYPPLFEALELPGHHRACGAMMVGYPAYRYQRCPTRKPPRVTWR